jgi:hypothetical protein
MTLRTREQIARIIVRALSLTAMVVGILSLVGVRPMNSRTIEVVLGTASLVMGAALFGLTMRANRSSLSPSIARGISPP